MQKRTLMQANRRLRVRQYTRTGAACTKTDAYAGKLPTSCPIIRAHRYGVCRNGHSSIGKVTFVSGNTRAWERRVQKQTSDDGAIGVRIRAQTTNRTPTLLDVRPFTND